MTTLELKAKFQKEFEAEKNNSIIEKVQAYYLRLKNAPCQFSKEELIDEINRSLLDAQNGGGKSMEEMRKKHPRR